MCNQSKIKGIKGQIIISGIGGFETDEQIKTFKELWMKPSSFKHIKFESKQDKDNEVPN